MIEMERAEHYFIEGIKEPEVNSLEFYLICAMISEDEVDIVVGNQNLGPAREIIKDDEKRYRITFKRDIGYSVLDESYAELLGDEFTGFNPRVYSKSNFLDYIKTDTFASNDYPGEFKHYAFLSENHVINVASDEEPVIKRVATKPKN